MVVNSGDIVWPIPAEVFPVHGRVKLVECPEKKSDFFIHKVKIKFIYKKRPCKTTYLNTMHRDKNFFYQTLVLTTIK